MVAKDNVWLPQTHESFTQFRGCLAMMFSNQGKDTKAIHTTSMGVGSEEVSRVTTDDQQHPLSHNSHRHQNKINTQGAKIATVKSELNHALDENWKLIEMFNPDCLVEAMMKAASKMTMREITKTSWGTQYHGNSNYIGRLR